MKSATKYRAARRNAAKGQMWKSTFPLDKIKDRSFTGLIRKNVSRDPAKRLHPGEYR